VIQFIVRRLLISIPVIFGVVFIVFVLSRIVPGDPCASALGERATPQLCATFNARIGLDKPIIPFLVKDGTNYSFTGDPSSITNNQFAIYLGDLASGDLGTSVKHGRPVTTLLFERMPTTIELTFYALVFAIVVGVGLGIIAASRHNSKRDVLSMMFANLGVSIPVFVLGLMLAYLFGVILKDTFFSLPPSGRLTAGFRVQSIAQVWGLTDLTGPPRAILDFISNMYTINGLVTGQFGLLADALRHLILPAIALGTIPMAIIARMTRSSLLDVLGREYVRTAEAKGLRPRLVLLRHGLRNALLPVVTVIGLSVASLLSGAVLTETIFGLTGIGLTIFESISSRDYVVVQGLALLVALIYVVVNLITDVSYGFLDPRVRIQ
jgi:peptide/nickel transport system permease protein